MENENMEDWEIVDYCPTYLEDGNFEIEEEKSKLGWIIDTGLSLGKKLVITGFVVSSVPFLLPPLVVVSAIGCGLSVPFGVVFASYVGTQKLMSKLLPSPALTLPHDEDDEQQQILVDADEKQEKEQIREGIEARNELVDYNERLDTKDGYLVEKDEGFVDNVGVGGVNKEEIRKQESEVMENEGEKDVMDRKETENIVLEDKNEEVEKITVATVKGTDKDEKHRTGKRGKRKTLAAFKFPGKRKEAEEDKRHGTLSGEETVNLSGNNLSLEEKPSAEVVVQEKSREKLGGISGEKEKCATVGSENVESKEITVRGNRDDLGNIESSLEKEEKPVDLKKITDVSVETNGETTTYISTTNVVASKTDEEKSTTLANEGGEYSLEAASLTGMPEEIPVLKEERVDGLLNSDEGIYDDEKIWKKMDAIRGIVGFKAPRRDSYFEELKALYLFTGIEPPSDSSIDPSSDSAAEFNNKLCFLMSVIGLK